LSGAVERVHATAIEINGRAALIRGPSGAGKSDLAFRCITQPISPLLPKQARLIADDQVLLTPSAHGLTASAPPSIAGQLEVHGVGIVDLAHARDGLVVLTVNLLAPDADTAAIERMPDPWPVERIAGFDIPCLRLHPWHVSSHLKLLTVLTFAALPALKSAQ
jgi:HPr kinase/phosphorylase